MNFSMKYLPILMTASVSTRGMKGACFSDEERYGMYLGALRYYVDKFFIKPGAVNDIKIVFADNSGWDLMSFRDDLVTLFGLRRLIHISNSYPCLPNCLI